MDFPRGRGDQRAKHGISGGGGSTASTARPTGTENPGGWRVKLEKPSVGGWIFSGTTHCTKSLWVNMVLFRK